MKKILTNRWFLAAIALIAISLVVWCIGPLIGIADARPLESATGRVIFILSVVLIWLVVMLIKTLRSQRASKQLAAGLAEQKIDDVAPVAKGTEVRELRERFDEALGVLKQSRGRKGKLNLYELPWYVIIGPPGSGKTTLLLNSGLHFPLADRFGDEALRGVGGTRNCDWWFTDQAILLDTAGRYVTQDSDSQADSEEWLGFLDLLKKYRRRRPINGVLLGISISEILQLTPHKREEHLQAIRQRLNELYERCGMRVPIYVMLTKADLIAGFTEFFEGMSVEEREQVWGMTFSVAEDDEANAFDEFDHEFDALIDRLNTLVLGRVDRERDPTRRALVYDFPAQMVNIKELLQSFLADVFRGSRYETVPLVRGVYFTSGTQEGSPIDRVIGAVSRSFGLSLEALPAFRGEGRSYFVGKLLPDVIFTEAELAGTNRRVERRRVWLQSLAYAGVIAATGLFMTAWAISYYGNEAYIENAEEQVASAYEQVSSLDGRDRIAAILPALDAARSLPNGYAFRGKSVPLRLRMGLSQGGKVGDQSERSYRRLLDGLLLPRLMLQLEAQLKRGGESENYLYEALKVYLMLDSTDHFDDAALIAWFREVWPNDFGSSLNAEELASFSAHVAVLFEVQPPTLVLDDALVETTRRELLFLPLENRAYGRIKQAVEASDYEGFSIAYGAGSSGRLVFARSSGKPLSDELSPMFSRSGYCELFVPESARVAERLLEESWILGQESRLGALETTTVVDGVKKLYFEDYVRAYEELLLDLELASFGNARKAARMLQLLSSNDSPLLLLIEAVKAETDLTDCIGDGLVTDAVSGQAEKVNEAQSDLASVLGRSRLGSRINRAFSQLNYVQQRFKPIQDLLPDDGEGGAVQRILDLLRELYEFMNLVANEESRGAVPANVLQAGQQTLEAIRAEAESQPEFLANLMTDAAEQSSGIAIGGLANFINNKWRGRPARFCEEAIAGRYPVDRFSSQEIRLSDFAEFFRPGGIIQKFFDDHLSDYVDTSDRPWRARRSRVSSFSINASTLKEFERANAISEVFFRTGGESPKVRFEMTPVEMDTALESFSLTLDGQSIEYSFGPRFADPLQWPGPDGTSEVRLRFMPPGPSGETIVRERGPWAWFRILESSMKPALEPETFQVVFSHEGREIRYELVAESAFNPFQLEELREFSCPKRL